MRKIKTGRLFLTYRDLASLLPMKNIAYLLIFFYFLIITIWGLNKGIDFTDEGYLILGVQKNQETLLGLSNYFAIFKLLFFWINPTLLNLRILNFILAIISAFIFFKGLHCYLGKKRKTWFWFIIILIGNIIPISNSVVILSYNSLGAYFLLTALGFFLHDISGSTPKAPIFKILSGLFLSFVFLIKIPSLILLIFLLFIYPISNRNKCFKSNSISIFYYLLGFFLGLCIFLLKYGSLQDLYLSIVDEFQILNNAKGGHDTSALLMGLMNLVIISLKYVIGISFLLSLFFLIKKIKQKSKRVFISALFKLLFTVYFLRFFSTESRDASPYYILVLSTLLYALLNSLFNKEKIYFEIKKISVGLILFLMPFLLAFGTNNNLISNAINLLPSWIALLALLNSNFTIELKSFFLFLFFSFSPYFFYYHYVVNPHRKCNLTSQTLLLNNSKIKIDRLSHKNINLLKQKLTENGFKKGDPIITLFKLPGLIYLLEGTSPGSSLSAWDSKYIDIFLSKLKQTKIRYEKSYLILTTKIGQKTINKLNKSGINYPEEYEFKGNFKLYSKSKKRHNVKLYVHKKLNTQGNIPLHEEKLSTVLNDSKYNLLMNSEVELLFKTN